jgi:hypothetical protein
MARRAFFRYLGTALLMLLLLYTPMSAWAAPRYPEKTDLVVSDNATIFSKDTVDDLNTFHNTLKNKTGVKLWVVTVHFLDGQDVLAFGREVFRLWNLSDEDLLLLLSSGDEEAVTIAGNTLERRLSKESQQQLLNFYFLKDFQSEQYESAFRQYIPKLATSLGNSYGQTVSTADLFGIPAASPTAAPTVAPSNNNDSWMDFLPGGSKFFTEWEKNDKQTEAPSRVYHEEKSSGFSLGSLFILFILFSLIFGSRRRRMGDRAGCMGCGCGPLGWIFAGLGLNELFKNRRHW